MLFAVYVFLFICFLTEFILFHKYWDFISSVHQVLCTSSSSIFICVTSWEPLLHNTPPMTTAASGTTLSTFLQAATLSPYLAEPGILRLETHFSHQSFNEENLMFLLCQQFGNIIFSRRELLQWAFFESHSNPKITTCPSPVSHGISGIVMVTINIYYQNTSRDLRVTDLTRGTSHFCTLSSHT